MPSVANTPPLVVALGDLLLDIAVQTKPEVLHGADCFVQGSVSPGGSAANFAVWVARLRGASGLIAKVGADILGQLILQDLAQEGVESGVVIGSETTGFIVITTDADGERTMLAARGATATLSPEELDLDLLDRAAWLHVSAYSFLDRASRSAALVAMRRVKARGGIVSLDPSSYGFLQDIGADTFFSWVDGLVDVFFPNLDEGRVLAGTENPSEILKSLLVHFPTIALKLGAQGAIAASEGRVYREAGHNVAAVDTTGAGDAFAAAFVVQWLAEHDLDAAVQEGNRLAADVVQVPGARFRAGLAGP